MKIKVQDLLAVIDDAVQADQTRIEIYANARRRFDAQREQDWQKNVMPAWRALATMIRDKSKRRQKITDEDVNAVFKEHIGEGTKFFDRRNYPTKLTPWTEHGSSYFAVDGETFDQKPVPNTTLPALRRFLTAVQDDTVSPAALKNMGFDKLDWLFRKAISK